MKHLFTEEECVIILRMREAGATDTEIGNYFGLKRTQIKAWRKNHGHVEKPEGTDIIKWCEHYGVLDRFDYIGGFTNTHERITLKCKACGNIGEYSCVTILSYGNIGKQVECQYCKEKRLSEEKAEREYKKERERIEAEAVKKKLREEREEQERKAFEESREERTCEICGRTFITAKGSHKRTCSSDCSKKLSNITSSHRKDHRLDGTKRDKGITAKALYTRDKVCWICGKECDPNDYSVRSDGTIICGNNYPSVDHVIPVCEGGLDVWDNVKLAHRRCNSLRYLHEKERACPSYL